MKIIISPNSGSFSLKHKYIEALFEQAPHLFNAPLPASELRLEGQSDEELLHWHDCAVLRNDQLYFLKENSAEVRTNPLLIGMLEAEGSDALAGQFCSLLKIVEIPDDVEWYLRGEDDGSEAIHEKHRTWA